MAAKKKTKDNKEIVKKISGELLELMGTEASVEVSEDEENEAILVDVDAGEEAGLIIGNRGRTINSIQSLIGMIHLRKTDEWKRIIVNVADWREKEEVRTQETALAASQRAKETGKPQNLYNLTPAQRRIVHTTLSEDEEVDTVSEGEGEDRYLVVSPKEK